MGSKKELRARLRKARRKMNQEEANMINARSRYNYWRRMVEAVESRLDSIERGQTEMPV